MVGVPNGRVNLVAALLTMSLGLPASALPPAPSPPPAVTSSLSGEALSIARDAFDRLTVPVMVDGRGPFPFVVDTGADRTVLSTELAASLGLPPGRPVRLHGTAGVGLTPTVLVEAIEVGGRRIPHVTAPVLAARDLGGLGLLGVDSLRGRRVVLDFLHRRMSVEPSRPEIFGPEVVVVRARSRLGQLVLVDASIARTPIFVILDSGAQNTIGNPALRDLVGRGERGAAKAETEVISVSGQATAAQWGVAPSVKVGGFTLKSLPIAYADLHTFRQFDLATQPAMLLGIDVMRHFDRVVVDFGRREVSFHMSGAG